MLHQGRPDQENKMRPHALRRARIEARRGRGHGRCPTSYWVCPSTRPQEIVINASPAQVTKRKLGEPFVAHQSRFVDRSHCGSAATRGARRASGKARERSEEHTSELQSLMRISYAVFCLKKKTSTQKHQCILIDKHDIFITIERTTTPQLNTQTNT